MSNDEITADALDAYIQAYRRIHVRPPKLRDIVERFGGRLLNVIMALGELNARKPKGWTR